MNIVIAIIIIGVIVIVHEFGHFILAKANGVQVLEFCIGFGPKLLHFEKGGTVYSIKLIPFGGACIMLGEDMDFEEDEEADDKNADNGKSKADSKPSELVKYDMTKSLNSKSVWARFAIIVAGPLFNFLLAFILAVIIIGNIGYDPSVINVVKDGSPAEEAGLQEGDVISSVNGRNITFAREYSVYRNIYPEKDLEIEYVRDGNTYTTTVKTEHQYRKAYMIGVTMTDDAIIGSITKDSPAEKAGMKINDQVMKVGDTEVVTRTEFSDLLARCNGDNVVLTVKRDSEIITVSVKPDMSESESYYNGLYCYGIREKASPIATIGYSVKEVGYWIRTVFDSLAMMFRGQVSLDDLSGPVGIVNYMGQVVEQTKSEGTGIVILSLLNFAVMLSANLGVMNLLPLPALDGGRLVFILIEAIRGKPVPREKEGMVHFVGMVLLMILMVVVLFNDVKNIFF